LNHVDLCVSSMERSLPFYRALLAHLGTVDEGSIRGERGEVVVYLNLPDGAIGLREAQTDRAVDRYAPGLHHLALDAPSRDAVDAIAAWLREEGAAIDGGPGERDYTPGYYAVFFFDNDCLKLEVVHQPRR
jgi:catechol 2,3-dioxygenase-like lactoylglutathione lyase family enzyme